MSISFQIAFILMLLRIESPKVQINCDNNAVDTHQTKCHADTTKVPYHEHSWQVRGVFKSCEQLLTSLLEKCRNQDELHILNERYMENYHREMTAFFKELGRSPKSKKWLSIVVSHIGTKSYQLAGWNAEYKYHKADKHAICYKALKNRFTFIERKFDKLEILWEW